MTTQPATHVVLGTLAVGPYLGDSYYEDIFVDGHVAALEAERVEVLSTLDFIRSDIMSMFDTLRDENSDLWDVCTDIEKQIREILESRKPPVQNVGEDENHQQRSEEHAREFFRKNSARSNTELRDLYRKIAAKCHPDKTRNPLLHELFLEAKQAYEDNDLNTLQFVWLCVQMQQSVRAAKLKRKREELKQQISNIRSELSRALTSQDYAMAKDWKTKEAKQHVMWFYRTRLMPARIQQLQQQLNSLRPPPVVHPTSNGFHYRVVSVRNW
jgi:hypothetical protein